MTFISRKIINLWIRLSIKIVCIEVQILLCTSIQLKGTSLNELTSQPTFYVSYRQLTAFYFNVWSINFLIIYYSWHKYVNLLYWNSNSFTLIFLLILILQLCWKSLKMPITLYRTTHVRYEITIYTTTYIVLSLKYRKTDNDILKDGERNTYIHRVM
jgi:hypothetical protein